MLLPASTNSPADGGGWTTEMPLYRHILIKHNIAENIILISEVNIKIITLNTYLETELFIVIVLVFMILFLF